MQLSSVLALMAAPASVAPGMPVDVLVVDKSNGPGTDYVTLQAAVDAAVDGDLLLIRGGDYAATAIDGKSIVLQGADSAMPWLTQLSIKNVAAGQAVIVRDCNSRGRTTLVQNCEGTVRFENGSFEGLDLVSASDVVLRSMEITTGAGDDPFGGLTCYGGLTAIDSSLAIYYSVVEGIDSVLEGIGGLNCYSEPGIVLAGSRLYLQRSFVEGGDECGWFLGGLGCFTPDCQAPGLTAAGAASTLEMVDSAIKEGRRGSCAAGPAILGVTPTVRAGEGGRIDSPSPLIEGQTAQVRIDGEPGEFVFLALSAEPDVAKYYALAGFYHGKLSSTQLIPVGTIPAGGSIGHSFQVPLYGGPDVVTALYLQPFFVGPFDRLLGAPTQVYVLDPAY